MAKLTSPTDEIFPVCFVGEDIYDRVKEQLSNYKNINLTYVRKVAQKNTSVKLLYKENEERDEILANLMPALQLKQLKKIEKMDLWLINFFTGFEMNLGTFTNFCKTRKEPVFMDFHCLARELKKNGTRYFRPLINWEKWIKNVDVLQLNEQEAASLLNQNQVTENDLILFGKSIVSDKLKIINITLGSKGSFVFYLDKRVVKFSRIPPVGNIEVKDVTGCGDAFLAAFSIHYLKQGNAVSAAHFANITAGKNCTIKGTENLHQLEFELHQIKQAVVN
ncbi:hypothetical protein B6I21_07960 [candidate division KSB1 bacterium 4572_119]|nr:MAG: hypothetical protein B6I21_07960 [candidate division KSB1 bacterium 4572_119]